MTEDSQTQQQFWDEKYSGLQRVWSGKVNVALSRLAEDLTPGTALDLGCGEGGDAIWLAQNGWMVTGADISQVALDRAAQIAKEQNVESQITFERHDFTKSFPKGTYDLVSAHFLHSPIEFDRTEILKQAGNAVSPGGSLLLVDHAAFPPWAKHKHDDGHEHHFDSAQETYDSLELDPTNWETIELDTFERQATGPEGQTAMLEDSVIFLKRAN